MPDKNLDICAFCGKTKEDVNKLIASDTVSICDECIDRCAIILQDNDPKTYDEVADIAIMIPTTKIETIKPIKLRTAKSKHMYVGTKTIYSGYPNNHSMLTIHGWISGFTNEANLIIDTYGWGGASGSSVFDEKGRLLGVLSAMDVGTGLYGMPRLIPDVIIIIPATKIDFEALDILLDK